MTNQTPDPHPTAATRASMAGVNVGEHVPENVRRMVVDATTHLSMPTDARERIADTTAYRTGQQLYLASARSRCPAFVWDNAIMAFADHRVAGIIAMGFSDAMEAHAQPDQPEQGAA